MNKEIIEVSVDDIVPNRFQPRLNFDEKELKSLSDSIKAHGIIQPLVLRRLGDKYEIIAGERRYKASVMAGLTKVPAIIKDIDDNSSAELAVIENVQRKNLSSIEEALSYQKILNQGTITQEQLASRLGIAQSTLANKLRLLNLTNEAQEALLKNRISERHARSLLSIKDEEEQKKMLDKIISERLTVKQTDEEISRLLGTQPTSIEEPVMNLNNSKVNLNSLLDKDSNKKEESNEPHFDINMLLQKQDSSKEKNSKEPSQELKFEHNIETPEEKNIFDSNINDNSQEINTIQNDQMPIEENNNINIEKEEENESEITPEEPPLVDNTPLNNINIQEESTPQDEDDSDDDTSSFTAKSFLDDLLNPQNASKEESTDISNEQIQSEPEENELMSNLLSSTNFDNKFKNDLNTISSSSQNFEDITPNLDNIFSSFSGPDPVKEPELSSKPVIDTSFINNEIEYDNINQLLATEKKSDLEEESIESNIEEPNDSEYQPLGFNRKKKNIQPEIKQEPDEIELPQESTEEIEVLEPEILELDEEPSQAEESYVGDFIEEDRTLKGAINKARDLIENIKSSGFDVDSEEIDFAEEYQIIIKIKKEEE